MIVRITTLFLLFSMGLSAQILKIDEKRGFKDFKIGNDKSKYNGLKRIENNAKSPFNLIFYEYIYPEKYPVFSYNSSRILLGFDNLNKLSVIQIDIKDIEDIKDLISSFSLLFGDDYIEKIHPENFTMYGWFGKEIILTVRYPIGEFTQIMILPSKTINEKIQTGF